MWGLSDRALQGALLLPRQKAPGLLMALFFTLLGCRPPILAGAGPSPTMQSSCAAALTSSVPDGNQLHLGGVGSFCS